MYHAREQKLLQYRRKGVVAGVTPAPAAPRFQETASFVCRCSALLCTLTSDLQQQFAQTVVSPSLVDIGQPSPTGVFRNPGARKKRVTTLLPQQQDRSSGDICWLGRASMERGRLFFFYSSRERGSRHISPHLGSNLWSDFPKVTRLPEAAAHLDT